MGEGRRADVLLPAAQAVRPPSSTSRRMSFQRTSGEAWWETLVIFGCYFWPVLC